MRVPPIMISKGLEPWTRQITTVQPHHDSEFVNRKERSNLRVRRLLLSDIDATGTCTGEALTCRLQRVRRDEMMHKLHK